MIRIPIEDVISKIKTKIGLTDEQIEEKIKQKLDQLSGLVSREGAAHIIANELGVKLYEQVTGRMKINKLLTGMRSVEIVGKVMQIFEIREFQRNDGLGMVGSFIAGDETGTTRIVCWGEKAKILNELKPEIIIKVIDAYVRENNGRKELHCNDKTKIILHPKDEIIGEVKTIRSETIRKKLSELKENDSNIEILGTIVQIFDLRFYNVCPECRRKVVETEGEYTCQTHKKVTPGSGYILNLVLDDGTATMRIVLFNQQIEKLISKTSEEMLNYKTNPDLFENVKTDLLGEYVQFRGRVQINAMFDRPEFMVNEVMPNPDPEEELKRLKEENN